MNVEPRAGVADGLENFDKVLEGASKAIGRPDGYHVDFAAHGRVRGDEDGLP